MDPFNRRNMFGDRDLGSRPLFDAPVGTIHLCDLVTLVNRKKNRLSDHWAGAVSIAISTGLVTPVEGAIFETDFEHPNKLIKPRVAVGQPFLGPDGLVMKLHDVVLCGCPASPLPISPLSSKTILRHPNFQKWEATVLLAGLPRRGFSAMRNLPRPFAIGNMPIGPTYPIPAAILGMGYPSGPGGPVRCPSPTLVACYPLPAADTAALFTAAVAAFAARNAPFSPASPASPSSIKWFRGEMASSDEESDEDGEGSEDDEVEEDNGMEEDEESEEDEEMEEDDGMEDYENSDEDDDGMEGDDEMESDDGIGEYEDSDEDDEDEEDGGAPTGFQMTNSDEWLDEDFFCYSA